MKDLGYEDRNAFTGLKTLTFVLFLYFTRVFFSLFIGFIIGCVGFDNPILLKMHSFLVKGLFFNQIIRVSMEAYFEFFLIGLMNLQSAEYSLSGEVLGALQTFFVLQMIFITLPFLSIFVLIKSKKYLQQRNVKQYIGELYESTKIETKL